MISEIRERYDRAISACVLIETSQEALQSFVAKSRDDESRATSAAFKTEGECWDYLAEYLGIEHGDYLPKSLPGVLRDVRSLLAILDEGGPR